MEEKSKLDFNLDYSQLKNVLNNFGEFPARYRFLLWRHLLKIPQNKAAYEALLQRGTHPAFDNFDVKYPIKSQRLNRAMNKCVNCIGRSGVVG